MSRERNKVIRRLVRTGIDGTAKSYRRAATQRLEAARFLLETSNYYLDAIYLAGYAAECSLKALILKRTAKSGRNAILGQISTGAKAHNLDFLEEILNRGGAPVPGEVSESLKSIRFEWSTDLRYGGKLIPYEEAAGFIIDVSTIYEWAERST